MIGTEVILSAVRREIHRTMQKLHKPSRAGLVSSYDPKQYAVKVQLQPEGTLTGWIPLTATAIGNQFGIYAAPNIKDQVEVSWQEGDQMTPRATTRHFSQKADKPAEVQAGEYHFIHGSGSVLRFLQDGSVQLGGGKTVDTGQTGQGQSGNYSTGNQGQSSDPNQQGQQQQPQKPNAKQLITFDKDGNVKVEAPQGKHSTSAKKDISRQSSKGSISDTAYNNFSRTAQNGNITDTAQAIAHNGNTNVTGTLGVTQNVSALGFLNSSDRRIKRGITKLTDVLSKVLSISFSRFDIYEPFVQDGVVSVAIGTATPSLGVIAQDVRKVVPEIVHGDESVEVLTVQESKIGVLAAAALQEYVAKTDAQIAALKARIAALEAQHEQ
jgi:Chaperone of endosialidase/Type VI secretion system/phage-baseplate injector OB domain